MKIYWKIWPFLYLLGISGYAQIEIDPRSLDQQLNDESTNIALSNELQEEDSKMFIQLSSFDDLSMNDLEKLNFLNESDRQRILDYISKHKPIVSILELQSIQELDLDKLRQIYRLIHVKKSGNQWESRDLTNSKYSSRLTLRWARSIPYDPKIDLPDSNSAAYLGSADKVFARIKVAIPGKLSIGLIAEKDEGEQWWTRSSRTGVDYLSAHIALENVSSKIKNLVFGDYRMRIGQGLILDNSFIGSSFVDLGYLVKAPSYLKPYHSLQENNMFRGAATTIQPNTNIQLNLFVSKSSIDANNILDSTSNADSNLELISSIQTTGYHRTKSEIEDRNALVVQYMGGSVKHTLKGGYLGYGLVHSSQNKNLIGNEEPYQIFYSKDKSQWFGTIFHQYNVLGILAFGECAVDNNKHLALIQGFLKSFGKFADMAIVYRNFDPSFQSRMSQVFSSSGKSQNEKGIYAGFNFFISKEFRVNLSWNSWQHPWLKYRVDLPTTAKELSARISYTRKRKWLCYMQYTSRTKQQNTSFGIENVLEDIANQSFRAHAEIKLNPDFTWRARAESHIYLTTSAKEKGYLLFQDILYKSLESRISGNFRFGFVKTDSYNSRIYAFENEMLYQFRIPAYYGTGLFSYVNLRTRITSKVLAEFRFSIFYRDYTNSEVSESYNYDKEIKFQIHYSFQ